MTRFQKFIRSKKITRLRSSVRKNFSMHLKNIRRTKSFFSIALTSAVLVTLSITIATHQIVKGSGGDPNVSSSTSTSTSNLQGSREPATYSSSIEIITQESSLKELGLSGNSYAGEVVSKMDTNVYPPREGIITNLTINIGSSVRQGQVIGQLSFPKEFDQIATTAEKKGDVEISKGKIDAINTQINEVQSRLNSRKSAADNAKNAKVNNANNEFNTGAITAQEKEERIKEAESEHAEAITSADNEISSLSREKREAEKEAQSNETVSNTINKGLDRNIYATRGGIISGIFKNVGDSVRPEDQIAAIGIKTVTKKDRCVRFKIPGNNSLPKVGDSVTISRPGMPFTQEQATITGVGTALDDNGHFVAEAFFEKIVDWPVHSTTRVQLDNQLATQIFIPLSAVWFDNEGVTSTWLADTQNKITAYNVKTGKAVGDRIEILTGLRKGDKIVLQPQPGFRNGDIITETQMSSAQIQPASEGTAGDGHDHEH